MRSMASNTLRKGRTTNGKRSFRLMVLGMASLISFLWTLHSFWKHRERSSWFVDLGRHNRKVSLEEALVAGRYSLPKMDSFPSYSTDNNRSKMKIHVLVGVLSGCCDDRSSRRRMATRRTWALRMMLDARKLHNTRVTLRFVLAQQAQGNHMETLRQLENELSMLKAHAPACEGCIFADPLMDARGYAFGDSMDFRVEPDLIFTHGLDTYNNLPLKTKGLMAYAASFDGITHLLKTDDDCYVRLPQLLRSTIVASMAFYEKEKAETREDREEEGNHGDVTEGFIDRKSTLGSGMQGGSKVAWSERALKAAFEGLYAGFVENPNGFWPVRDPDSKWYMDPKELPDSVPHVHYAAGWGYMLSRDAFEIVANECQRYDENPHEAPNWWRAMHWEDVMVALILHDRNITVQHTLAFRPAWGSCGNTTAIKHTDVDAPEIFPGLYAQQISGMWDQKVIQCNFGTFRSGSYMSWRAWRDNLEGVQRV